MPYINQLPLQTTISPGDQFVLWTPNNGDTRRIPVSALAAYLQLAGVTGVANATGNGTQTIFPLASAPEFIFINGIYQNRNTYTITNSVVSFSTAPPLNASIEFVFSG